VCGNLGDKKGNVERRREKKILGVSARVSGRTKDRACWSRKKAGNHPSEKRKKFA